MSRIASKQEKQSKDERYKEFKLLGLYPEGFDTIIIPNTRLKYFANGMEYYQAMHRAMDFLSKFKPVPEPLRTMLINEAENLRQHGTTAYN